MRTETTSLLTQEAEAQNAEAVTAPACPVAPAAVAAPARAGTLTALMALEEPARTEALEKAVHSGLTVYLQSTTGQEVHWRYGEHILVVPTTPKPFAAPHAIHLLFSALGEIVEVEG